MSASVGLGDVLLDTCINLQLATMLFRRSNLVISVESHLLYAIK